MAQVLIAMGVGCFGTKGEADRKVAHAFWSAFLLRIFVGAFGALGLISPSTVKGTGASGFALQAAPSP